MINKVLPVVSGDKRTLPGVCFPLKLKGEARWRFSHTRTLPHRQFTSDFVWNCGGVTWDNCCVKFVWDCSRIIWDGCGVSWYDSGFVCGLNYSWVGW